MSFIDTFHEVLGDWMKTKSRKLDVDRVVDVTDTSSADGGSWGCDDCGSDGSIHHEIKITYLDSEGRTRFLLLGMPFHELFEELEKM